jgi:hypothetical protein
MIANTFVKMMFMKETLSALIILGCLGCAPAESPTLTEKNVGSPIVCNEKGCAGSYSGAEFINGSDVAHQFSNEMSGMVGDQLKVLYKKGLYSIVDISKIIMSTKGMGSGTVVYELNIPFKRVQQKCDAFTSFDHVGGWDHSPALSARKKQLQSALMKGESLDISNLKTTPEGLQEYWIQWKNKKVQADCAH